MLHEYVILHNIQLLSILRYLPTQKIEAIKSRLWHSFAKAAGISTATLPKDKYAPPPSQRGLGLSLSLSLCALHKQTINNTLRHLHHDSPLFFLASFSVSTGIYSSFPTLLQNTFMDACHCFLIHSNGIGVRNVTPRSDIPKTWTCTWISTNTFT